MSKIAYKIEERSGVMVVVWENGAARNAGEVEVELWKRNRELEKAASELVAAFTPKTLEKAAAAMRKLEKMEPDASLIKVESKLTPTTKDTEEQARLKKRLEEKRRERERQAQASTASTGSSSIGDRLRGTLGLSGPKSGAKLP